MRLSDYRSRVFEVINKHERQPFRYGVNDCALFGADIVEAITGVDPAAQWRGKYRSAAGGLRLMKDAGYKNQAEWLEKHGERVETPFAQFGDIAVLKASTDIAGNALGVVGGGFIIGMSKNGLVRVGLDQAVACYRIL